MDSPENKHKGLHANRLHPDACNPLELIFSRRWAEENRIQTGRPTPLLAYLVGDFSERDAQVAATVIQWLGSNVGQSFVRATMLEHKKGEQQ